MTVETIQNFANTLAGVQQPALVKKNFFCTFNPSDGSIVAVSGCAEEIEGMQVIEICYDDGIAFMTGRENFNDWHVVQIQSLLAIKKREKNDACKDRVELLTICEFTEDINTHVDYPDVKIVIDHLSDTLEIHYNGENIQHWRQPMKIFLTREGDPSHLFCSLKLDINTLNEIQQQNKLDNWPNPITIKVEDADDISVFGNRYTHQVRLIHKR